MNSPIVRYSPIDLGFWTTWIGFVLFLAVAPIIFHSNLALTILSQIGTVVIAALSYNMLLGQTGMLSFGHAVYGGMGGFIAIHAMNLVTAGTLWIPTSLIPLVGGLGGAFFGVLFGYVTTKRSGTTFAMITLGIGELVASSALTFPEFFGGEAGITTNRVIGNPVLGITYGPQIQVYYLIAVWLVICTIGMYAFTRTPLGRIANAVRDNPERAEFIGYNTQIVRFLVVILAGFFAGVAGGLGAINFEIVSSENVGTARSGSLLLFTFLGGVGTFFGPIIGAVIYVFSLVLLSNITQAWGLYVGLVFIIVVMYAPGGIASLILLNLRVARYGYFKRLVPAYGIVLVAATPLFLGISTLIEMIYALQLDVGNGTITKVYGVTLDVAKALPWCAAAALSLAGAIAFYFAQRIFRGRWEQIHTDLEARQQASGS
ncbi:MAG: branched-chain amino acid ABC transporter permease [Burkholderiaceae bacterium]|jgi:branched-chain amino acid transport system permease protein